MILKAKPYKTISLATGIIVNHFKDGSIDVLGSRDCDDFEMSDCCSARRWNDTDICNDCREHASWEHL